MNRDLKKRIKRALDDIDSIERDMEDVKDSLNQIIGDNIGDVPIKDITQESILEWFESPFVSQFDKNQVLEKLKVNN